MLVICEFECRQIMLSKGIYGSTTRAPNNNSLWTRNVDYTIITYMYQHISTGLQINDCWLN